MTSSRSRARPLSGEHLPLRLRAPNPPAVFVGRRREADALEAALRRGPLSSVWGVGGLGKSALVFHVLHERFAAEVPRAVVVRLARGGSLDEALLTVATALAEIHGVTGIDWRSLLGDRDALVATAIDLAEGPLGSRGRGRVAAAHWIVIDDIHHAEPARAAEITAQLARYARRSRWIVIGRTDALPDEAEGQAVALGSMAPDELRELARSWGAGGLDDRVITAAAGSPWRLKQLLGGAEPGLEPGAGDPLFDLDADTSAFLADLSLIEAELPLAALARFTAPPPPEALAALERRGLVERGPRGLRLHDVARAFAAARLDRDPDRSRARRLAAAEALLGDSEAEIRVEALRLLVHEGESARAAAELDAHGEALIEGGQLLGLWRVLERASAAPLASWRLRCAIEIGDAPALREVPEPPSPSPADRARWALSLFLQGQYDEAERAATAAEAAAIALGLPALADEAARIAGRAQLALGQHERALAIFAARSPATPRQSVQRDADLAACLVHLERPEPALELLRGVEARLESDPAIGDSAIHFAVAWVLYLLGSLRLAERAARRLAASSGGVRLFGLSSARYLVLAVGVAHDRGAPREAAEVLEKLVALRSAAYAPFIGLQRTLIHLALGRLDGLAEEVDDLVASSAKTPREDVTRAARGLRCRLAITLGEPPTSAPLELEPGRSTWQDYQFLWEIQHRARWGEPGADPSRALSSSPEIQGLALLTRAWAAIARGAIDEGRSLAAAAVASSAASGYGVTEALALECAATAALLDGAPDAAVEQSAAALAAVAAERGLAPLGVEAELLALVASPARFKPAQLEPIALSTIAPAAARRARALLGEEARLDRIDEAVVAEARRRTGCTITTIIAGSSRGTTWGIDERTRSVWLPDRAVALAERPLLFRILRAVADAGGALDKEALVLAAWTPRDYHPLRDDARLHTAIRTLRRLIEDDPAHPTRLVTTEDGYRLGRVATVRRAR